MPDALTFNPPIRILTFDIEDWYHLLEYSSTQRPDQWSKFTPRIEEQIEKIVQFLLENNQKASFFMLGWIADKFPQVVRTIDQAGFEIGMHSYAHQPVYLQSREEFLNDTRKCIDLIENITTKKVRMYRAPGFSIMGSTTWALHVIADLGIEIDCSIFPTGRSHGGFRIFPTNKPCLLNLGMRTLKEFPMNTYSIMGEKVVFSGGGYFRFFPYLNIRKMSSQADYLISYLHPHDLDVDQPRLKLGPMRYFRAYYGLKNSSEKLQRWIHDFTFTDISTAEKQIDWTKVRKIDIM